MERNETVIRLLWTGSVHTRNFLRRYMPTNILLDAIRTPRGIKAEVVTGDNLGTFISAKRVITVGILLGPLGAFGGALLKKNGTRVHVMLERDGENIGWIESTRPCG